MNEQKPKIKTVVCPKCKTSQGMELINDEKEGKFYLCTKCEEDFSIEEVDNAN